MYARIEAGYREKFRRLLARVQPRRLEFGVELLLGRARAAAARDGVPLPEALARLYEFTRVRVDRRVALMAACAVAPPPHAPSPLLCDPSLGGLARWLRAAGHQADWVADRSGPALIALARERGATLVTSDSRLATHGLARSGAVELVWVPSSMTRLEQLRMVMADLGLVPGEPRCMDCGGALETVAKAVVNDRIPPRTRLWKDDYFVCRGCGKVYWQGTHWERIRQRLAGTPSPSG